MLQILFLGEELGLALLQLRRDARELRQRRLVAIQHFAAGLEDVAVVGEAPRQGLGVVVTQQQAQLIVAATAVGGPQLFGYRFLLLLHRGIQGLLLGAQIADARPGAGALLFHVALFARQLRQLPLPGFQLFLQRTAFAIAGLLGPAHIGNLGFKLLDALPRLLRLVRRPQGGEEGAEEQRDDRSPARRRRGSAAGRAVHGTQADSMRLWPLICAGG